MSRIFRFFKIVLILGTPPLLFFIILAFINYQRAAADLPPLNSEFDVQNVLRGTIEGERRNLRSSAGTIHPDEGIAWPRPTLAAFPHDFVTIYLAVRECPTFFQTQRESNLKWAFRVFMKEEFHKSLAGRDGRCELGLAREIASHLRVAEGTASNIAAYRIRLIMTRDQMVAYDLAAMPIERGYFGVNDASRLLLRRDLKDLSLAELVELSVALPPFNRYEEVRDCRSLIDVKVTRDDLLSSLGEARIISEQRADAAKGEALSCAHR